METEVPRAAVAVLALRGVALAMAAATMALTALGYRSVDLLAALLSIGLFTLAVSAFVEDGLRRQQQEEIVNAIQRQLPQRPPRPSGRRKKK